ncbi:MAG: VIT and VWA domain-containing protein [Thermodesulfobacteriota bacterium]
MLRINQHGKTWKEFGYAGLFISTLIGLIVTLFPFKSMSAGLLLADGGFGGRLEIIEHDVKVTVNNNIAVTEINQVFENMEERQVEALYTFPVPKGASVANFSMWINGREMIGEVVEKERAREIYNSYKRVRRDPGLLEQTDYKTFEMRIFPIASRAKQRVRISYYQELDFDHDRATYVYPLATTSKGTQDSRVNGKFAIEVNVKSVVPITEMVSPSHGDDFLMVKHGSDYYEASLEQNDGDLSKDVVIAVQTDRGVSGLDLITSKEQGEDGFFQMTLTAASELEKPNDGNDFIFILDVSGSMANEGKLGASRSSIDSFITTLGDKDRFEVITFNRQARSLFNTLTTADEQTRSRAGDFLASQEAKGGTSLQPALTAAYKYGDPDRPLNVVILSDGMTEQAERHLLMDLIRSRPANVRVFCVGVGNEINRPLLQQMAEDAGGLAAFISRGDDFKRQARGFRRKLIRPAATGLKIEVAGVDIYDVEPKQLPNLFHGMPLRIYGRYKKSGEGTISFSAEVNGRPIETTAKVEFPAADDLNPEIERMWAQHRIKGIEKQMEGRKRQQDLDEIVRLGEAFSITSEYTSFLVLENDAEYKRWNIERRNVLRIKKDRTARQRVREELARMRTKAVADIGPQAVSQKELVSNKAVKKPAAPSVKRTPERSQQRSQRADLPRFSGGGALDPLSCLIILAIVVAAIVILPGSSRNDDQSHSSGGHAR